MTTIKKNISSLFLLLCINISAQNVIQYGDPVYMFNSPQATLSTSTTNLYNFPGCPNISFFAENPSMHTSVSQAYWTGEEAWIYGIAVTFYYPQVANADVYQSAAYNAIIQNYIDSVIASNRCVAVTLHSYNTETKSLTLQAKEYIQYPNTSRDFVYVIDQYGSIPARLDTVRSTEVYFDSPIAVTDTFFVGVQMPRANKIYDTTEICLYAKLPQINGTAPSVWTSINLDGNCTIDTAKLSKWIYFPNENDDNLYEIQQPVFSVGYGESFYPWGFVFPILYPREDGCTAPGRPWAVERGDTWATLEWDTLDGPAELVVSTDFNGDPDTMSGGVALAAGSAGYTVTGLMPSATYGAWLRRECHWVTPTYDTTVWSPWSFVCLFNTTGSSDIEPADEVAFSLSPNPAHGTVNVLTDCLPATLVLYDPQGRTVYTATLRARNTAIGIADLTRGVYHVSLTATDGTAIKRLVIE